MIRRALLAAVLLVAGASRANAVSDIALWVELDGSTSLWNTTGAPITFQGYQFASQINELDPAGWKSINDYVTGEETAVVLATLGAGGLSFNETTAPSASQLSEVSLLNGGTLAPGAKFSIGKPLQTLPVSNQTSTFWDAPGPAGGVMDIVYAPEPGTLLLAALARPGLVAMRARSKRQR